MSEIHILNLTWNIATHNQYPLPPLTTLLQNVKKSPDFVVFGFQELLPQYLAPLYSYSGFQYNINSSDARLEPWMNGVKQELESKFNKEYNLICGGHLVAIGLFILSSSSTEYMLKDIWTGSVGTGLCGVYGNKGAVAIALDLTFPNGSNLSVCFVASHLGAHEGEPYFIWRNNEVYSIFQTLVLADKSRKKARLIHDHDTIFFSGDLNYRLKGDKLGGIYGKKQARLKSIKLSRAQIDEWIHSNDIASLLERDELNYSRLELNAPPLDSFEEANIEFLPSYKLNLVNFKHASELQHLYSSKRCPAYCDRIFYKAKKSLVDCECYTTVPDLGWSDHQPVVGIFHVTCSATGYFPSRPFRELYILAKYARVWRFLEINGYRILILMILILLFLFF